MKKCITSKKQLAKEKEANIKQQNQQFFLYTKTS